MKFGPRIHFPEFPDGSLLCSCLKHRAAFLPRSSSSAGLPVPRMASVLEDLSGGLRCLLPSAHRTSWLGTASLAGGCWAQNTVLGRICQDPQEWAVGSGWLQRLRRQSASIFRAVGTEVRLHTIHCTNIRLRTLEEQIPELTRKQGHGKVCRQLPIQVGVLSDTSLWLKAFVN